MYRLNENNRVRESYRLIPRDTYTLIRNVFTALCSSKVENKYVDGRSIAGPCKFVEADFQRLKQHLDVSTLVEPEDFLGMHIVREQQSVS